MNLKVLVGWLQGDWVATLWDCHTAMGRVLEARGGLNFISVIKKTNLTLLFAKQLYDFCILNYQQILFVQTTTFLVSHQ